jgi:hypothetical protein
MRNFFGNYNSTPKIKSSHLGNKKSFLRHNGPEIYNYNAAIISEHLFVFPYFNISI